MIEISDFLGHEGFHHQKGRLFIKTKDDVFTVEKGESFTLNKQGLVELV